MSRKHERLKAPPKVLDREARARQVRHHLESLERDNFVALNEFEAIIATAAAAAAAPGPGSLTATNVNIGMLPSSAVGSIVGGVVGTIGPGAMVPMTPSSSSTSIGGSGGSGAISGGASGGGASGSGGRASKKQKTLGAGSTTTTSTASAAASGGLGGAGQTSGGGGATGFGHGHRRPTLSRKPLAVLLDESGLAQQDPSVPSYLTAAMGPSQYPERQFCSVCGWRGNYRCFRCGMRYCDLRCQKTHEETRCMKFTI